MARAAPVVVGTMLMAAPRDRRGILVERVDQLLVTGIGVDGRHEPVLDAEGVIEHLGQDGQAVRRARGVGDDEVVGRVELFLVHADDQRRIRVPRGSGDDHPGGTGLEVGGRLGPTGVPPGRLDDDVDAQLAPRKGFGFGLGQQGDPAGAHDHRVAFDGNRLRIASVHGVTGQEPGQRLGRAQVVDGHDLEIVGGAQRGPQERSPRPAETVDCHSYRHRAFLRG